MSTEFGIALCALIGVIVLVFDHITLEIRVNDLKFEIETLREQNKVHEKTEVNLIKRIDKNGESCSQVNDLGIEIKVCQKDIEHALEMIEELKAQRSMDILDRLREEDKE